jgi:hypothetical protein
VVLDDVVSIVDSGLVEGGGGSCTVFASVVFISDVFTSVVFTPDVFTSVVFTFDVHASDVSASNELDRDVITWLDGLAEDRSEVIMTDGVELDIGAVDGRVVSSEVGMLDIGAVFAIDTGEAVY